jgi:hypothetical protein
VVEPHQTKAIELATHKEPNSHPQAVEPPPGTLCDDPRVIDLLNQYANLHSHIEGDQSFLKDI